MSEDGNGDTGNSKVYLNYKEESGNGSPGSLLPGLLRPHDEKLRSAFETALYWLRDDFASRANKTKERIDADETARKIQAQNDRNARKDLDRRIKSTWRLAKVSAIGTSGTFFCCIAIMLDRMAMKDEAFGLIGEIEEKQSAVEASQGSFGAQMGHIKSTLSDQAKIAGDFEHLKETLAMYRIGISNQVGELSQQISIFARKEKTKESLKVIDGYDENEASSTLRAAFDAAKEETTHLRFAVGDFRGRLEKLEKTLIKKNIINIDNE